MKYLKETQNKGAYFGHILPKDFKAMLMLSLLAD
jgi:hypothetical protein